ncbi:proliferating cell nuclear antigen (pcna) [Candidatus Parvarchaeota archaeon]|jgi:proliferating cell nuclear antigen PCNA|nr:MAG: proliferating cell nuclear antigen (pcna) [Candidatus Parvarchaeota archaeon]HIG52233.1 proliferating cell nuclear antigen (pcna) [Candidatus Pacearchaeota archaeon]
MKLKLDDPRVFANLVGVISELVTEVRLKVNSSGMNLVATDPASVAMVHFHIPSELFSEFQLDEGKEEVLGINLGNLKNILRRCKLGSSLIIEKADNFLKLGIKDKIKRDFTLALIEVEGEERELPEWEFKSIVKMSSDKFVDSIEDCMVVSDACTFAADSDKFVIEAKGLNSARSEFSGEDIEIFSDNNISRFSLEYLSKFIKGAKIADRVEINFSDNHPMRLNFPTGKVMLSFVLAPRIEQED